LIAGETPSVEFAGAVGPENGGDYDAFVAKVLPAFPWILFSPAMNRQDR